MEVGDVSLQAGDPATLSMGQGDRIRGGENALRGRMLGLGFQVRQPETATPSLSLVPFQLFKVKALLVPQGA